MKFFLKILAGAGGVLVLLVVAAAIAVSTVDVNDFIAPIQKRVKEATGRDLAIHGGIALTLSLEPKLVISDVSLGNATWGLAPQMLTAARVEAQMHLLPLLRRRFEIDRFSLIGPQIALETNSNGQGNWEFSGLSSPSAAPTPGGGVMSALAVGDLSITDGTLSFRDGKTGSVTRVVIESLSLHARDSEAPISAQFRGRVADVAVAVEGDVGPLAALVQRRWPYPISMHGEINSNKATLSTKVRAEGSVITLDELQVGSGSSTAVGNVVIAGGGKGPQVSITLMAPTFALADLPFAHPPLSVAAASEATRRQGHFIFKDDAIDFTAIQAIDADLAVTVGKLLLSDGRHVDDVQIRASFRHGRVDAPMLQASTLGGKATARLVIDASGSGAKDPAIELHLDASGVDLAQLLAALGEKRDIRGGKVSLSGTLSAHGRSPRQWVSDMSGVVTATTGAATLSNNGSDSKAMLNKLGDAINPARKSEPSTELVCAVLRLPIKGGIATVDRSIAFETRQLGASASGVINFKTETLDLSIKPQLREGVATIEIPQIAQLVSYRGPFSAPTVGIDATATAATVARLGAAIGTGGWSVLGESLLSAVRAGSGGPCQQALGPARTGAPPQVRTDQGTQPATDNPQRGSTSNPLGKALDKLLRR